MFPRSFCEKQSEWERRTSMKYSTSVILVPATVGNKSALDVIFVKV